MNDLPDNFIYKQNFLTNHKQIFQSLQNDLDRKSYSIKMFGKIIMQPRLVSFYGDNWVCYKYSQTTFCGSGRSPLLENIKKCIIDIYPEAITINSVLCNLYRDGSDSMWWHADDEAELWKDPYIYSVSLWVSRNFQIKSKLSKQKYSIILEDNSIIIMWSKSQIDWLHSISKTKTIIWPRINLTFRTIVK